MPLVDHVVGGTAATGIITGCAMALDLVVARYHGLCQRATATNQLLVRLRTRGVNRESEMRPQRRYELQTEVPVTRRDACPQNGASGASYSELPVSTDAR